MRRAIEGRWLREDSSQSRELLSRPARCAGRLPAGARRRTPGPPRKRSSSRCATWRASPSSRETQISGLLARAKANSLFGIIWFDATQNSGLYHQNWNLEADQAAAAAFRAAVASS